MQEKGYTKDGILFESVKIPQTLFKDGPLGIAPTYKGENAEGNKGIIYSNDTVTEVVPFINAVDIDWNGAKVSDIKTINSTSELLNWIKEKLSGESAYEIARSHDSTIGSEEEWLFSLKGETGLQGPKGDKGDKGDTGQTPTISIGRVITLNSDEEAKVELEENPINHYKITFKIPRGLQGKSGKDGVCQIDGQDVTTGEINTIESISVNNVEILPDENKNVNIDLSGYATTEKLEEELATKLDTLLSRDNIKVIAYPNTKGSTSDLKYVSFLPSDGSYKTGINTSSSSSATGIDPNTGENLTPKIIYMSKVAFTGKYEDILNTPNDDKYVKIFRKSLREEANMYYPDRDSIQRIVYELRGSGEKSEVAEEGINTYTKSECNEYNRDNIGVSAWMYYINGNPNDILLYTVEQAAVYNSLLEGAIISGTHLTDIQASLVNDLLNTTYTAGLEISDAHSRAYNQSLEGHVEPNNNNFYHPDDEVTAHNLGVLGAYTIKTLKLGISRLNSHWESAFIQNLVYGDHSVALGWGCLVGNKNNGNHSFAEGKWTNVLGDFSHASGLQTLVNGDYSFSGGINLNDGEINGHYSFGYGKDLITNNNGEVAFGQYNKSQTIEMLKVPNIESNKFAYDSLGNPWKIIDFYNISISNFEDYINTDFGEYYPGLQNYLFGFNANETQTSGTYSNFMHNIYKNYKSILNKRNCPDIVSFLITEIFDINWHKSIHEYLYEQNPGGHGWGHGVNGGSEKCIIGVVAQKIDELGNPIQVMDENNLLVYDENDLPVYEYEFFVWGPNSLYYKHELSPRTMLSFGNGNENKRSNLIEVTDDGNIHYANGDKSLFELESQLDNISHNINLEIDNISTNNSSIDDTDLTIKKLIIPINDNTPSILIVDDFIKYEEENDNKNRYIYLNILNSQHSYYKKTLIIDLNKFYSITDGKIFIEPSLSISIYGKEGITGNMLELSSYGEYEDGICRIILETIQNKCIVEFDECLKKIETE